MNVYKTSILYNRLISYLSISISYHLKRILFKQGEIGRVVQASSSPWEFKKQELAGGTHGLALDTFPE